MDVQTMLGQKVRMLRKALGLSQEELGHRSGLTTAYIGLIERGERNITLDTLLGLTYGLGVRLPDLLDFADEVDKRALDDQTDEMLTWFRAVDARDRRILTEMARVLQRMRMEDMDKP